MCFFFRSLFFFTQWGCQQNRGNLYSSNRRNMAMKDRNIYDQGLIVTKKREDSWFFHSFSISIWVRSPTTTPLLGPSDPVLSRDPEAGDDGAWEVQLWSSGHLGVPGHPGMELNVTKQMSRKCRKAQKKHWILSCFNDSLKMAVGTTCGQDSNSNGDAKRGCSLISTIGVVDISPVMIFFSLDDWDFIIEPMSASEFTRISIRTGCFWHESRFTIGFESQRSIKIHHSEWCGKPNAINHPQITIFMGCINKPQLVVVYGIGFLSLFTISLSINNHYLESSWSLVY